MHGQQNIKKKKRKEVGRSQFLISLMSSALLSEQHTKLWQELQTIP